MSGSDSDLIQTPSRHFLGGTEENYEKSHAKILTTRLRYSLEFWTARDINTHIYSQLCQRCLQQMRRFKEHVTSVQKSKLSIDFHTSISFGPLRSPYKLIVYSSAYSQNSWNSCLFGKCCMACQRDSPYRRNLTAVLQFCCTCCTM
jgi:hypothetical protein